MTRWINSRSVGLVPDVLLKTPSAPNLPATPEHTQRILQREPAQATDTQLRGQQGRHHHADEQPDEGEDEGGSNSGSGHGYSIAGFSSVT